MSPQRPPDKHAHVWQLVDGQPLKLKWMYAVEARENNDLCWQGGKWFEGSVSLLDMLRSALRR
jgi:hypothetical protein